jgi:hypothetical protein
MKALKRFVVVAFAVTAALTARAELSAQAWLETYYLNPQPAELPRAIQRLSREGYFDEPKNVAIAIGFIATVFAQNPQQVDGWLVQLNGLPFQHQRLVISALWQAGLPLGNDLLRQLAPQAPNAAAVAQLATMPAPAIEDTPVLSLSSMNLRWGAFLASGNQQHIVRILEAIGEDRPGLDATARLALAQNAAAHPRVMEICRAQLDKEPEEIRNSLRAALLPTQAKPRS